MDPSDAHKVQRLLDYHFSLDDPDQRRQTERLLADDPELQNLDQALRRILAPLSGWPDQEPPAGLADRTIQAAERCRQARTMAAASAAVAAEPHPDRSGRGLWVLANFRDFLAAAAAIMLFFGLLRPGWQQARQVAHRNMCAAQMRSIGFALAQYSLENLGKMPYVNRPENAKWLPVGSDQEDHASNTQNLFLLIKLGYIAPESFLCPACSESDRPVRIRLRPEVLRTMQDFASRGDIHYSFLLILPQQSFPAGPVAQTAIASDMNPLFADIERCASPMVDLENCRELMQKNSPNHQGSGQTVLFGDGHARFSASRCIGLRQDDIYTLEGIWQYDGDEWPTNDGDTILAP
ncbi:MAG: hypothetical protein JW810_01855 [Sedimentisphaerales bacterium]|nr:hypothetical protein [Sedimentisphaerales bacterium]